MHTSERAPAMADDQTTHLQKLIARMQTGEAAARQAVLNELITATHKRLRGLVMKFLREDFPRLKNQRDPDSVLNDAVLRLMNAIQQVQPKTVEEFIGLAALQIRRVLIDWVRKSKRQELVQLLDGHSPGGEVTANTYDPVRLAMWTDWHVAVDSLPEAERQVIDLCWYCGLTKVDAAGLLGLHPRKVSHLWVKAIRKLPDDPSQK
jgi:RNA polymerase sigma factor (sigma-70 family)